MSRSSLVSRTRIALAQCLKAGALAIVVAWTLTAGARSPGDILEADLRAAGAAVRDLRWTETPDHVQTTVADLFPGSTVGVDARGFPARVVITLRALDRNTCLDALARARRIEGKVVIELRGFHSPEDCRQRNDMTWLILP